MFCGLRPYDVRHDEGEYFGHFRTGGKPAETNREIIMELEKVLQRSVAMDIEERYRDFRELREALNAVYQQYFNEDSPFYEIEIPDSLANDFNNRGFSFYLLGEEQKSRECWEEALKADPKHLEATFNLGCLKWKNAEDTWSNLLQKIDETENRSHSFWLCKGWIHFMEGNTDEIEKIQESEFKISDPVFIDALTHPDRPKIKCVQEIKGHTRAVLNIHISNDSNYILSGSDDHTIRLWEIASAKEVKRFIVRDASYNTYSFSPDGKYVLNVSEDFTLQLLAISTGFEICRFEGHSSSILTISFSGKGLCQ